MLAVVMVVLVATVIVLCVVHIFDMECVARNLARLHFLSIPVASQPICAGTGFECS